MRFHHTDLAPAALGPYSQAVSVGGWVYTAGQIGLDPATGELVPGGVAAETRQALRNLAAVLAAAETSFAAVVRATIYLADLADFAVVNEIYAEAMAQNRPARSTVEVAALPKGAAIEIDLVAFPANDAAD